MASGRIIKRTPTKSIKGQQRHRLSHHLHRHRRSPQPKCSAAANAAAASILESLNKSIFTCHRRLLRFFSRMARIRTPSNRRAKGFKILKNQEVNPEPIPGSFKSSSVVPRRLSFEEPLMPPMASHTKEETKKKTIFLDLDETLIHASQQPPSGRFDFVVRPKIDGEVMTFFVVKRPGVDQFLERIAENYEVVIFTAGLKEYASLVLERLDRKRVISHRLYRDSCKEVDGKLVKDLSRTGRDLGRVVIVDDNPNAYLLQPDNAVPIRPFTDDLKDRELSKLLEFFEGCHGVEDMRIAVKEFVGKRDDNIKMSS